MMSFIPMQAPHTCQCLNTCATLPQINARLFIMIVFNDQRLIKSLSDLGKIGSNLNQIARYLNQGVDPTGEMLKEVRRCITDLNKIRDEIDEMAGEYRGNC